MGKAYCHHGGAFASDSTQKPGDRGRSDVSRGLNHTQTGRGGLKEIYLKTEHKKKLWYSKTQQSSITRKLNTPLKPRGTKPQISIGS